MPWCGQEPKGGKQSTKYRCYSHEGAFFGHADFSLSEKNKKQNNNPTELKPQEIMTKRELISSVGSIWSSAALPLSFILSSESSHRNLDPQENSLINVFPVGDIHIVPSLSGGGKTLTHLCIDKGVSLLTSQNLETLCANTNYPLFESCNVRYSLWRSLRIVLDTRSKGIDLASQRISYDLENVYGWMSQIALCESNLGSSWIQNHRFHNCFSGNLNTGNTDCHTDVKPINSMLGQNLDLHSSGSASNSITSCSKHGKDFCHGLETGLDENGLNQQLNSESEIDVVAKHQCQSLAKREHAFAGAMAGICVSICLHPMDTIKTIIQSCHADRKSLYYIGRLVISERGIMGLFRGIWSNIASSAPISALYTFTYEFVKGALLLLLDTEYQYLAHCIAGGSASVATSFIFTPSERIKQQMQVHSHYKKCWDACFCIIKNGGLPSLYVGWGAVLCRNIPHSIIKFYTYESLKQLMSSPVKFDHQNNTVMTLVCGGLSGSMAALFTTPFDVVKTRLQTQVPVSKQYGGVLDTLKKIIKQEGLSGLYRGLTPRLAMYVTQGALFFASYESFKKLLSLDVCQLVAQRTHQEQCFKVEDSAPFSVKV